MKEIAEDCFGRQIKSIVITVPIHFNISQYHQAIKDTGLIADLNIIHIINSLTTMTGRV